MGQFLFNLPPMWPHRLAAATSKRYVWQMSEADTLNRIETDTWNALVRAVVDKKSPLRWITLATVSPSGQPQARTVVLRAMDRATRTLTIYTDRRAAKVPDLSANPKAEIHIFDSRKMLQYRLSATAAVLTEGPRWQALFDKLPDYALSDYAALTPPGTPGPGKTESGLAAQHFTVIDLTVHALDWLSLSRDGHERARFVWQGDKSFADFVTP